MSLDFSRKKLELEYLKKYCKDYIDKYYGVKNNYIRSMRITKNGLFIYGHNVYSPLYGKYKIYTFINWYDSDNYNFIQSMLDNFVLDCKRLKECE